MPEQHPVPGHSPPIRGPRLTLSIITILTIGLAASLALLLSHRSPWALLPALLALLLALLAYLLALPFLYHNIGHRAAGGGTLLPEHPENSLGALRACLEQLQGRPGFVYLEYDVHETWDRSLVVFHDRSLARLVDPHHPANSPAVAAIMEALPHRLGPAAPGRFEEVEVWMLTEGEVCSLCVRDGQGRVVPSERIPSLQTWLATCAAARLLRPMAVEVKSLRTDEARERLVEMLSSFVCEYLNHAPLSLVHGWDFPAPRLVILTLPNNLHAWGPDRPSRQAWLRRVRAAGLGGVFLPVLHRPPFWI